MNPWLVWCLVLVVVGCKQDGAHPYAQSQATATATAPTPAAGSAAAAPAGSAATAAAASATPTAAGSASAAGAAAPASETAARAAAGGGSASTDAAPTGYKVGDLVYGKWTNGRWYPGKIGKLNDDGTYRVNYNDGDVSPSLSLAKIKPRTARPSGGGGGRSTASASGGAQPCPASHWTRCGNNCYLLSDDRYNCGRCGNACPSNRSVCRNGRCDCTGVEKDSNGGVCP